MHKRTNIIVTMGCVIALLLLSGCSTKKNTLTRRMYHNLTSHYNIYFNGDMAIKDGE